MQSTQRRRCYWAVRTAAYARGISSTLFRTKKRKHRNFDAFFFGGKRWIRTTEGGANRFTVCSLWPLGNLPTLGAGGRSRTNNLLITNQLLCH